MLAPRRHAVRASRTDVFEQALLNCGDEAGVGES